MNVSLDYKKELKHSHVLSLLIPKYQITENFSSIANCRTIILRDISRDICNFSRYLKFFINLFHDLLAALLMTFPGALIRKQGIKNPLDCTEY
jgi:hypothetical protein